jgi:glycogen operon protein
MYEHDGRRPAASINFVTAHDGFTLRDLVSYNEKHNEANGEDSADGESHNRSWNCGVEGETDDPEILELRARQSRNMIATLLFSQGVPMISHGDELGRTQEGNNNGYCQDNELTWIDWENVDTDLLAFTQKVTALRAAHPVFRRRRFFEGRPIHRSHDALPDIAWLRPDGSEMTEDDWSADFGRAVGLFLNGSAIPEVDDFGERIIDNSFLLLLSAHYEPIDFPLPKEYGESWEIVIDTMSTEEFAEPVIAPDTVTVGPRALTVLRRIEPEES